MFDVIVKPSWNVMAILILVTCLGRRVNIAIAGNVKVTTRGRSR